MFYFQCDAWGKYSNKQEDWREVAEPKYVILFKGKEAQEPIEPFLYKNQCLLIITTKTVHRIS